MTKEREKMYEEYRRLGMTEEQIKVIKEYDDRIEKSDCEYYMHTVSKEELQNRKSKSRRN